MTRILIVLIFTLVFAGYTYSQTSENTQTNKGGIIFKIPENVFPMDWKKSGFKGILMLTKDSPSGIFVCYPDDNEKIEELRERAAKFIAPMFIRDEKEKKELKFQKSLIPNHKGDFGDSALYYLYSNEKSMVQIIFYERAANSKNLIYGYFAMKNKEAKDESVKNIWADENGRGVKMFEDFWQTLKE